MSRLSWLRSGWGLLVIPTLQFATTAALTAFVDPKPENFIVALFGTGFTLGYGLMGLGGDQTAQRIEDAERQEREEARAREMAELKEAQAKKNAEFEEKLARLEEVVHQGAISEEEQYDRDASSPSWTKADGEVDGEAAPDSRSAPTAEPSAPQPSPAAAPRLAGRDLVARAAELEEKRFALMGRLAVADRTRSVAPEEKARLLAQLGEVVDEESAVNAAIAREAEAAREGSEPAPPQPGPAAEELAGREPVGPGPEDHPDLPPPTTEEAPRPLPSAEPVGPTAADQEPRQSSSSPDPEPAPPALAAADAQAPPPAGAEPRQSSSTPDPEPVAPTAAAADRQAPPPAGAEPRQSSSTLDPEPVAPAVAASGSQAPTPPGAEPRQSSSTPDPEPVQAAEAADPERQPGDPALPTQRAGATTPETGGEPRPGDVASPGQPGQAASVQAGEQSPPPPASPSDPGARGSAGLERQAMLEDRRAMMAAMRQQGPAEPPPDIHPDKREMMLAMSKEIGPSKGGSENPGRQQPEAPRTPPASPSSDRGAG